MRAICIGVMIGLTLVAGSARAQCPSMLKSSTNDEGYLKWKQKTCIEITVNNLPAGSPLLSAVISGCSAWNNNSGAYEICFGPGSCIPLSTTLPSNDPKMDYTGTGTVELVTAPYGWTYGDNVVGYHDPDDPVGGYITGFHIYINMDPEGSFPESKWTTSCPDSGKLDLGSVAMHEMGHALGLDHPTSCTNTVMRTPMRLEDCYSSLLSDDKAAIAALYNFNPAATVEGFSVIAGTAAWDVSSELHTAQYRIDGANSFSGPWLTVATDTPGTGAHQVDVSGSGFSHFRLVEIETDGGLRGLAMAEARAPGAGRPVFTPPDPARLRGRLDSLMTAAGEARLSPQTGGEVCVIFTDSLFVADVENYVASFWRLYGYDVRVVPIDGRPADPDSFRTALKASIAAWADTANASYFHLIGDANDWREFDGPLTPSYWTGSWEGIRQGYLGNGYPAGGQPEKDIIPTFAVADTAQRNDPDNMTFTVPYYHTDQPYADTDNDGVPDVVVTRWPVSQSWQLLNLAFKMQNYNLSGYSGNYANYCVGAFAYDRNINVYYSAWAWRVRAFVDSLAAHLEGFPSVGGVSKLYGADFSLPVPGPDIAAAWNAISPDVVIMGATNSERYFPCEFLNKSGRFMSDPFYVGLLSTQTTPVVVAGSCGSGDFAWTEYPYNGLPISEEMLYQDANRGAIAWIGPSQGTWLMGNEAMLRDMADELLANPVRPMAASYLAAVQAGYTRYSGETDILATIQSYNYLGDPLSPLKRPDVVTAVRPSSPALTQLGMNYPNPFNPTTTIPFSLTERARVTLTIYDVAGRQVRVLVNSGMSAGTHEVRWDGMNANGQHVTSGIYFAVFKTEAQQFVQKLVLVQ